jgi:hypothetical protein
VKVIPLHHRVRPTEITTLIQSTILGFVTGELWYFGQAIGITLNAQIETPSRQGIALIACVIAAIIVIAYFYIRDGISDIRRLWMSKRIDLLALVALGISISSIVGGSAPSST